MLIQDVRPGEFITGEGKVVEILKPCDRNHVHLKLDTGRGCWDRNTEVHLKK